jgi:hemoglobin-like flavoprotein
MGCASSNQNEDAGKNTAQKGGAGGGGGGGKPGETAEPAEAAAPKQNPYMSLTHKDIFHLKMSWKGIKRSMEETGVLMFVKLFEANADIKNYFEKFKNLSNDKLFKSQLLINHATTVMETLDTTIMELDDADKTHSKLKKLGLDHKARGVGDSILISIKDPFLKAVEETLGDRYSDRMRTIYEVYIDYVIKAMVEGYNS